MRIGVRRIVAGTVATLVGVVLTLSFVSWAHARWATTLTVRPGVVRAADFRLTIHGPDGVSHAVVDGGTTLTVPLPGALLPGEPVAARMDIVNETLAGGVFSVAAGIGGPVRMMDGGSGLAEHLVVGARMTVPEAGCESLPAEEYVTLWDGMPVMGEGEAPVGSIGRGEAMALCVLVALAPNTPSSLSGTAAGIRLPLALTQEGR